MMDHDNIERTLEPPSEEAFDIALIPYRGADFAQRFGYTVRDLMILLALQSADRVSSILWLQRPSIVTEWLNRAALPRHDKLTFSRKLDLNVFGQMYFRRAWAARSMRVHERMLRNWSEGTGKILLDFHPFYIPPKEVVENPGVIYWYDLIDNFEKHNLFSARQKQLVRKKYSFVRKHARFVTGVSDLAVEAVGGGHVIANRLVGKNKKSIYHFPNSPFDFGFTGFITDKFDVALIERLSNLGYNVLIRGKAYDNEVLHKLRSIENVTVGGAYHHDEQAEIIRQFSVGLVPYKPEKSHDESPIKLWQYLAQGSGALLSMKFGLHEKKFDSSIGYYSLMSDRKSVV